MLVPPEVIEVEESDVEDFRDVPPLASESRFPGAITDALASECQLLSLEDIGLPPAAPDVPEPTPVEALMRDEEEEEIENGARLALMHNVARNIKSPPRTPWERLHDEAVVQDLGRVAQELSVAAASTEEAVVSHVIASVAGPPSAPGFVPQPFGNVQ